jgi:hypothetical protein
MESIFQFGTAKSEENYELLIRRKKWVRIAVCDVRDFLSVSSEDALRCNSLMNLIKVKFLQVNYRWNQI